MTDLCTHCGSKFCSSNVSLFSTLEESELAEVKKIIKHKLLKKGEQLYSEGQVLDCLFIVNKGAMKIFSITKEGREQILYLLQSGDFIGDMSLFKKSISLNSAIAVEDTILCIIQKADFDNLLHTWPVIQSKMLAYAYDRIQSLEKLIDTLATKDIESRIASLLLNMLSKEPLKENGILYLPLNKEEMANFIGVTRETLSRKLNAMQRQGLITLKGNRQIRINHIDALEELNE